MENEEPVKIAILGAGPIGLEAALYARFLGYEVVIYDRGRAAENVLAWGHVRMFSPFRLNRSSLGLAALESQDTMYRPLDDEALHTGRQWAEQYLIPLSRTDLLADCFSELTTVIAVGRSDALKGDSPGGRQRSDSPFRLIVRDDNGLQRAESADIVIDATGVFGNPNWMGMGGIPAIGETDLRHRIEYGAPDILGIDSERFASHHTLLVGSGYSAATNVVALDELAGRHPGARVTWITRRASQPSGPMKLIPADRLPQRDRLSRAANALAGDTGSHITHWSETTVQAVSHDTGKFSVELAGLHAGRFAFDQIIANVGYRPDNQIYQELQVHECYATTGPMKLAAELLAEQSADCLDQTSHGSDSLLNPEPDFYILGSKSYGRNSSFLFSVGLQQIRELFSLISGRAELDLYANVKSSIT